MSRRSRPPAALSLIGALWLAAAGCGRNDTGRGGLGPVSSPGLGGIGVPEGTGGSGGTDDAAAADASEDAAADAGLDAVPDALARDLGGIDNRRAADTATSPDVAAAADAHAPADAGTSIDVATAIDAATAADAGVTVADAGVTVADAAPVDQSIGQPDAADDLALDGAAPDSAEPDSAEPDSAVPADTGAPKLCPVPEPAGMGCDQENDVCSATNSGGKFICTCQVNGFGLALWMCELE